MFILKRNRFLHCCLLFMIHSFEQIFILLSLPIRLPLLRMDWRRSIRMIQASWWLINIFNVKLTLKTLLWYMLASNDHSLLVSWQSCDTTLFFSAIWNWWTWWDLSSNNRHFYRKTTCYRWWWWWWRESGLYCTSRSSNLQSIIDEFWRQYRRIYRICSSTRSTLVFHSQ